MLLQLSVAVSWSSFAAGLNLVCLETLVVAIVGSNFAMPVIVPFEVLQKRIFLLASSYSPTLPPDASLQNAGVVLMLYIRLKSAHGQP